jgi:bacterioferritin-associated ferredoxin
MIVCHCEVVSDRHIRAAVDDGAASVDEVGSRCLAGTNCGSCRSTIATLLARLLPGPEEDQPAA